MITYFKLMATNMVKLNMKHLCLLLCLVPLLVATTSTAQSLQVGFYDKTCPNVEAIVRNATARYIKIAPSLAAPLLRMHFHDCFVRGCDGSVLLNGSTSEKTAIPNQSLRGFQVIDGVKAAVEKACPGVVSCADILALVARDAVSLIKGPSWKVPTGRRDGRVSNATEALINLPPPSANISSLISAWQGKGLSKKDLVVLSGGHTIGTSHCPAFTNRLYNFTGVGDEDPNLDSEYIPRLKSKCRPGDVTTLVEMDPGSFRTFDTSYYTLVSKRRGLFQSDSALLNDGETQAYIRSQTTSKTPSFFEDFGVSMVRMGNIEVLTGTAGEIRKQCAFVN